MHTSVPHRNMLQLIVKPKISEEVLIQLFDCFRMYSMRSLSRALYLPSFGSETLRGKTLDSEESNVHSLAWDLDGKFPFHQRIQFPNGLFWQECEVKIEPSVYESEIHQYYVGITTRLEWVVWRVMIERKKEYDRAHHAHCLSRQESMGVFCRDLNRFFDKKPILISMWDTLHSKISLLVQDREKSLAVAKGVAQSTEIINHSLQAHLR